jgi:hypothetical protein
MIPFLNRRLWLFSLFSSLGVTLLAPLILLLLLLSLILLVALSVGSARMLKISFKPRTGSWGVIWEQNVSFGSFVTSGDPGDPACAVFTLGGVRTVVVLSDNLGGDASLFDGLVQRLDKISVKVSIAAFNLLPVLRNGFAAAGFVNASVSSSKAVNSSMG